MATKTDDKTASEDISEIVLLPADDLDHETLTDDNHQDQEPNLAEELAAIKAERDALRAERDAARGSADDANRVAADSQVRTLNAQESAVESKIVAANADLKNAKDAFTKASEEGRFADASELAEKIADARTKLNAAAWEKDQIAQHKEKLKTAPATTETRATGTPEEQFLAGIKSPESRRWLVAHRDVMNKMISDPRYFSRVSSADALAYAELGERDTPAYFEFIEGELGINGNQSQGRGTTTSPPANSRRNSPARNDSAGRTIHLSDVVNKLTPSMKAAARTSFPDRSEKEALETYARGIVISRQRDPDYLPNFKF